MAEETSGVPGGHPQVHHIEPRTALLIIAGVVLVAVVVIALSMQQRHEGEVAIPAMTEVEQVEVVVDGTVFSGGGSITYDVLNNTGETIRISNYAPLNTPTIQRLEENEWRTYKLVVPPPPTPMPGEDARDVVQEWPIDPGKKRTFYRPLQTLGGNYPGMAGGVYRLVVEYRAEGGELRDVVSEQFTVQ